MSIIHSKTISENIQRYVGIEKNDIKFYDSNPICDLRHTSLKIFNSVKENLSETLVIYDNSPTILHILKDDFGYSLYLEIDSHLVQIFRSESPESIEFDYIAKDSIYFVLFDSHLIVYYAYHNKCLTHRFDHQVTSLSLTYDNHLIISVPYLYVFKSDLFSTFGPTEALLLHEANSLSDIVTDLSDVHEVEYEVTSVFPLTDLFIKCDEKTISLISADTGTVYYSNSLNTPILSLRSTSNSIFWAISSDSVAIFDLTLRFINTISLKAIYSAALLNDKLTLVTPDGSFILDSDFNLLHSYTCLNSPISMDVYEPHGPHFLITDSKGFHFINKSAQSLIEGSFKSKILKSKILPNGSGFAFLTEDTFIITSPLSLKPFLTLPISDNFNDFSLNEESNMLSLYSGTRLKEYYLNGDLAVFRREIITKQDIVACHYLNNHFYLFTTNAAYYNNADLQPKLLSHFSSVRLYKDRFIAGTFSGQVLVISPSFEVKLKVKLSQHPITDLGLIELTNDLIVLSDNILYQWDMSAGIFKSIINHPHKIISISCLSDSLFTIDENNSLDQWGLDTNISV